VAPDGTGTATRQEGPPPRDPSPRDERREAFGEGGIRRWLQREEYRDAINDDVNSGASDGDTDSDADDSRNSRLSTNITPLCGRDVVADPGPDRRDHDLTTRVESFLATPPICFKGREGDCGRLTPSSTKPTCLHINSEERETQYLLTKDEETRRLCKTTGQSTRERMEAMRRLEDVTRPEREHLCAASSLRPLRVGAFCGEPRRPRTPRTTA